MAAKHSFIFVSCFKMLRKFHGRRLISTQIIKSSVNSLQSDSLTSPAAAASSGNWVCVLTECFVQAGTCLSLCVSASLTCSSAAPARGNSSVLSGQRERCVALLLFLRMKVLSPVCCCTDIGSVFPPWKGSCTWMLEGFAPLCVCVTLTLALT